MPHDFDSKHHFLFQTYKQAHTFTHSPTWNASAILFSLRFVLWTPAFADLYFVFSNNFLSFGWLLAFSNF